jgi:hypothetical protein
MNRQRMGEINGDLAKTVRRIEEMPAHKIKFGLHVGGDISEALRLETIRGRMASALTYLKEAQALLKEGEEI